MKPLFLSITLIVLLSISCKKDKEVIPNVPIDIYVYTNDPQFIDLNAVGGWVYVAGGSRGIIIYRKSNDEFMTYDRHCTYQPNNSCARVEVNSSDIIAVDSCCGSQFVITDGSVSNGPASQPLRAYQNTYDGTVLHIYN